jgi:hypothetical protein
MRLLFRLPGGQRAVLAAVLMVAAVFATSPNHAASTPNANPGLDGLCTDVLQDAGASFAEAATFCAAAFGNSDAALAAYELAQDAIDLANEIVETTSEEAAETREAARTNKEEATGQILLMMELMMAWESNNTEAVERITSGATGQRGDVFEILLAVLMELQEDTERDLARIAEEIESVTKRKQAIREVKEKLEQAEHDYYVNQIEGIFGAILIVGARAEAVQTAPSLQIRPTATPTPTRTPTPLRTLTPR